MKKAAIRAFGKYLPPRKISNDEICELLDTSDEWIKKRTGISYRRISDRNSSEMGALCAEEIIKHAQIDRNDIDAIILATSSPDHLLPSTACRVQQLIQAKHAVCFDITAACSGFVYALSLAEKMICAGNYRNILVIGAEHLTKLIDWSDRKTAVLFGDGAGGVLLSEADKHFLLAEKLESDGTRYDSLSAHAIPFQNPWYQEQYSQPYMIMNGREILQFTLHEVPKNMQDVMVKANCLAKDIDYVVPHQSNLRLVEGLALRTGIAKERFFTNLEQLGNTSAASIPIALTEMWEQQLLCLGKGNKVLLVGYGAGLTWGSMLIVI